MDEPHPRWILSSTSTNDYGVTFFTLLCRDSVKNDEDYTELLEILKRDFGVVETGQLVGPYSVHKYLQAASLCFAVILDDPDSLDLYARDKRDKPAMELFVARLLDALNGQENAANRSSG